MIKPEDIIRAEFSRSFLGYDMKQVDTLLDAVIEEMEAWEKERSEMLTALEYLLQELEQQEGKAAEPSAKRLAAQEKTARMALGKPQTQSDAQKTEPRDKKRSRMKEMLRAQKKEQPLPQAVSFEPQQEPDSQQIPLAKAHREDTASAAFEIPTYVFAGSTDQAEPAATVAEEIEVVREENGASSSAEVLSESEPSEQEA